MCQITNLSHLVLSFLLHSLIERRWDYSVAVSFISFSLSIFIESICSHKIFMPVMRLKTKFEEREEGKLFPTFAFYQSYHQFSEMMFLVQKFAVILFVNLLRFKFKKSIKYVWNIRGIFFYLIALRKTGLYSPMTNLSLKVIVIYCIVQWQIKFESYKFKFESQLLIIF